MPIELPPQGPSVEVRRHLRLARRCPHPRGVRLVQQLRLVRWGRQGQGQGHLLGPVPVRGGPPRPAAQGAPSLLRPGRPRPQPVAFKRGLDSDRRILLRTQSVPGMHGWNSRSLQEKGPRKIFFTKMILFTFHLIIHFSTITTHTY